MVRCLCARTIPSWTFLDSIGIDFGSQGISLHIGVPDVVVFNKFKISQACIPTTQPIVVLWAGFNHSKYWFPLVACVCTKHAEEIIDMWLNVPHKSETSSGALISLCPWEPIQLYKTPNAVIREVILQDCKLFSFNTMPKTTITIPTE